MSVPYWKYAAADGMQQPQQQQQPPLHSLAGKRPRSDYDLPGGRELPSYFNHEDDRGTHLTVKDSDTIGASYDRYLRGTQLSPYGGIESGRPMNTGLGARVHEDPLMMGMGINMGMGMDHATIKGRDRETGLLGGRPEIPLPRDATNTLYVEGLPSNCSRREVAHIFRPFVGYREARLVTKESKHTVLCFVDFESPAEAATARDALQGYMFDEHDRDSVSLRIQFARVPGAKTGGAVPLRPAGGRRGRR